MKSLSENGSIPINELSNALKSVDSPDGISLPVPENPKGKTGSNEKGKDNKDKTAGAPSTANERPTSGR